MGTRRTGGAEGQDEDGTEPTRLADDEVVRPAGSPAARKRAAVELISRHGRSLKQTARRYSLCAEDAEDAYQRALEILLTKAPTERLSELIKWTHTVLKHEALAIRRNRERLLGTTPAAPQEEGVDWVTLIPSPGDGPDVQAERQERIARSREALRGLKPAELRALTLLAEGYSYAEISRITGFSKTKVNRCLAEGRERFRRLLSESEDGRRCTEIGPTLSAFCDGEASPEEAAAIREHLRACASCRAAMRAYRAAPEAAAALVPALPIAQSLFERAHEAISGLTSRLPGAADSAAAPVAAAGGAKGIGMAGMAKLLAICAGGAATCVATGLAPAPSDLRPSQVKAPTIERTSELVIEQAATDEPAPEPPKPSPPPEKPQPPEEQAPQATAPPPTETAGAVEYPAQPVEPSPSPVETSSPPVEEPSSTPSGSAAGEFGP
jgi:RNA polymerase sigma factor (sigma-70 family)